MESLCSDRFPDFTRYSSDKLTVVKHDLVFLILSLLESRPKKCFDVVLPGHESLGSMSMVLDPSGVA